jgi:GH25 family lysozyme M1 (1,4-beta-N-acetylmuramidase)
MITANLRNTSTGKAVAGTVTITATTADGDSTSVSIKVVDVPTIVDLSHHQGTIDCSKASKSIDLAILRISDSDYLDTKYFEYSTACKDYGVPFGVYSYSRYRTKAQAEAEATLVYNRAISGGRKPAFFVIDAEVDYINRANTEAYIAKLRSLAGKRIKVGVYAANHLYTKMNLNLTTDVTNPKTPDFVWIPRYSTANNGSITGATAPTYRCDIWQYSSGGRIPGINGNVDMDTLYKADGTKLVNNANVTLAWLSKPA